MIISSKVKRTLETELSTHYCNSCWSVHTGSETRHTLRQMQRNDKLVSKRRLVRLETSVAVQPSWQAEVTQIYLSTAITVCQRQGNSQAPLSNNADTITRRIQTQHWRLVCIGPLHNRLIPSLTWQINITIQCRHNDINWTCGQTCIQSQTETRLPSNLRPITHEHVHAVMRSHFWSHDKDGGHTPFDPP